MAREGRPRWRPRDDEDGDDEPTKKRQSACPTGTFVRNDGVAMSGGPKPQRGVKRAQWDADGDRRGCVALPWLKTDLTTGDGGRGGGEDVKAPKKPRNDARTGAAAKRPLPTDGAAKRPRRIATPATAVKRPSASTPLTDGTQVKRPRAHGDVGRASASKVAASKTCLVRQSSLHGRPPPDKLETRTRLICGPGDSKKRDEMTAPLTLTALPS